MFNITPNDATTATLLRRRRSVEKALFFGLYLQRFFNAAVTPKEAKALKKGSKWHGTWTLLLAAASFLVVVLLLQQTQALHQKKY